jgi:predicted glutamine amidotransferase
METFKYDVRQATSTIVVGHIRQASNPKNLPNDKLIGIENSQPFWYGKYVFAHNGTINLPDETEARLGRYRHEVRGVNDSEVYFWFLMKEIFSGKSLSQSFEAFVKWLDTLWGQFRKDHPDKTHPYVGLNTILSDGNRLFAFCKFHDQYAKKRSLCQREQSYWQMSYLLQNDALIIASEPLTRDDKWRKLDSGSVLVAEVEHGRVSYEVESIPKAAIR